MRDWITALQPVKPDLQGQFNNYEEGVLTGVAPNSKEIERTLYSKLTESV